MVMFKKQCDTCIFAERDSSVGVYVCKCNMSWVDTSEELEEGEDCEFWRGYVPEPVDEPKSNDYLILIKSGGSNTGYMYEEKAFKRTNTQGAMNYFVVLDAVGANPILKIVWMETEDGHSLEYDYYLNERLAVIV